MLSANLEQTLHRAISIAQDHRHEYCTLEHLLLSMLADPDVISVLNACQVSLDSLKSNVQAYLANDLSALVSRSGEDPKPTTSFQRVLQRAAIHVQSAGQDEVSGANILVALFQERESHAVYFLQEQGLSRLDVVNYLTRGLEKDSSAVVKPQPRFPQDANVRTDAYPANEVLDKYCVNLNQRAKQNKIDPLVGRSEEIERVVQILARRSKNNPLFVGEPGVGKTAIVEGLAKRITEGQVPNVLKNTVIYSLDMGALLAGTRYRGDFEERFKQVLNEFEGKANLVMFIDEIHTLVGAGSTSGSAMDASNLLKPALARGDIRCMGSTTYQEFREHFEKDKALVRRFQRIDVKEPSAQDTLAILQGVKDRFETFHGVTYEDAALEAAVNLSVRYLHDRKLPDKAFDVIDEAAAHAKLQKEGQDKIEISVKDVEETIAQMARIPSKTISNDDQKMLSTLETSMKSLVFGQDQAIETVCSAIKLARAGLRDPEKPMGSYLFTGPTGVGKTEVAKQLSKALGVDLLRFDMSEYMESHSVSRLIGAPPGYVGFNQGGLLTDRVDQKPYSILLLDEIEKAHPDIFNLLLQVMDHGKLTDSNGKVVDFRNVVLIMTTNSGAMEMTKAGIGFNSKPETKVEDNAALNRQFTPEFRNRLDAIIAFQSLDIKQIESIVDKFMAELEALLAPKGVVIELSDRARTYLAKNGFDPKFGARPLARLIQDQIKKPLAEAILFGDLAHGGSVFIDEQAGILDFHFGGMPLPNFQPQSQKHLH